MNTSQEHRYPIRFNYKKYNHKVDKDHRVCLCIYRIIKGNRIPHVEYLLYNETAKNRMTFPYMRGNSTFSIGDSFKSLARKILPKKKFMTKLKIEGCIYHDKTFFTFLNLNALTGIFEERDFDDFEKKKKGDSLWWLIIDEICNHGKVLNIPVSQKTQSLFLSNPSLIYLLDKEGFSYEIPRVYFFGSSKSELSHKLVMRNFNRDENIMGSSNYLVGLKKAYRQGGWSPYYQKLKSCKKGCDVKTDEGGKYKNGYIVRVCVFLKNLKVLIDVPGEPMTNHLKCMKIPPLLTKQHTQCSDGNDLLWTYLYDNAFVGCIKNKQKIKINHGGLLAMKNSDDVEFLSFHSIDMKTLGFRWSIDNDNYSIL